MDDDLLEKTAKPIKPYNKQFATNKEFFSTFPPDRAEHHIVEVLTQNKLAFKVSETQYKIRLQLTSHFPGGLDVPTEICIRILQVQKGLRCIEFVKKAGDIINFNMHFKEIRGEMLAGMNDAAPPA